MNVCIIYLQPKDGLELILEELEKIPCDKKILRYFPYPWVYQAANDFIKRNPRYTHFVWLQNDIILTKDDFFCLCEAIEIYSAPNFSLGT